MAMAGMIAFCGLDCGVCPAYEATQNNDDEGRKKVAETWSSQYGVDVKAEEINCDGCTSSTGPHFKYCNVCEIRKCGLERDLVNCAHCGDYACQKLGKFFEMAPDAKKRLDGVRSGLST
jgi:hypothetical protein